MQKKSHIAQILSGKEQLGPFPMEKLKRFDLEEVDGVIQIPKGK
ncbi:hypothetical protein ACFLVM_00625 [Chloroflexota bacterium]